MSKIYRRTTLLTGVNATKKDKNRKRNVIMNFRVSPEEKQLIDERIEVLNTLREYLKQLEDENIKPIYYNAKLNGQ